ncbi:hypothetical protein [Candidatus Thiosymbion oneisti]|uniref:hypothetical protein n=1 Tax=Candidatus Thiosymbion oneisti TaxID=589554 RepID=UPI00105C105F|nr:hypothetical protein [Candidatus Thiosymbion oneisti]
MVQLEFDRYDYLLQMPAPEIEKGCVPAILAALKISERRCKLLGLDAPAKTAMTDPGGEKEAPGVVIYLPDDGRPVEVDNGRD